MSTRERWIVYPLLFLALGTALRPKLAPTTEASILQVKSQEVATKDLRVVNVDSRRVTAERVTCRTLTIVDRENRPRIEFVVSPLSAGGEVRLVNNEGIPLVALKADAATRAGLIETRSSDGRVQTVLLSSESGGEIITFDRAQTQTVSIGHRAGRAGLIDTNLKSGATVFKAVGE